MSRHCFNFSHWILACGGCALLLAEGSALADPDWWTSSSHVVIDTAQKGADFSVCNVGQLKNMAFQAAAEMDARLPGGAGPEIWALILGWQGTVVAVNDFAPANLGQLKAVAKPYYDRLAAAGAPGITDYPWTENGTEEHFAVINVGQLKNIFSFEIPSMVENQGNGGNSSGGTSQPGSGGASGPYYVAGTPIPPPSTPPAQAAALPPPQAEAAALAYSEVVGYVDVVPSATDSFAPVFLPPDAGIAKVTAKPNSNGSVPLALYGDASGAADGTWNLNDVHSSPSHFWRPQTGTGAGVPLLGQLVRGAAGLPSTLTYWKAGDTTYGTALKPSLLAMGDVLRLTPLWTASTLLKGAPSALGQTLSAGFGFPDYSAATVGSGAYQWISTGGTNRRNASYAPGDYVGGTFPAGSGPFYMTGLVRTSAVVFPIEPGKTSTLFTPDGRSFDLGKHLSPNAATGICGGPNAATSDVVTIMHDSALLQGGTPPTPIYYNTSTAKKGWRTVAGDILYSGPLVAPPATFVKIQRPLKTAANAAYPTWQAKLGGIAFTQPALKALTGAGDADGDGLPDYWEQQHPRPASVPPPTATNRTALDDDQDGFTNMQEYLLGGDPWMFDHPALPSVVASGTGAGRHVTVQFATLKHRRYRVETCLASDLKWVKVPWQSSTGEFDGTGATVSVEDTTYVQQDRAPRFYRVAMLDPGTTHIDDADQDGLADEWEEQNGLDYTNAGDALTDFDGDRIPNLWELAKGTNPGTPQPGPLAGDATVDGSQATSAASKRYKTLQEAYNAITAGTTLPHYAVIVVKPGIYTQGITANGSGKRICWLADTSTGLVTIKATGVAVTLNDTTVMDGFDIEGDSAAKGPAFSIVPATALKGEAPRVRLSNCVVASRLCTAKGTSPVTNKGARLTLVHCTLVNNAGLSSLTAAPPAGTADTTSSNAIYNASGTLNLVNSIVGTQGGASALSSLFSYSDTTVTASHSIVVGGQGRWGTLASDPGLSGGWHLTASSAARQQGSVGSGVAFDIYGHARPSSSGTAPDLGVEQWVDNLLQPLVLSMTTSTSNTVSLSWTTGGREYGYRLERSPTGLDGSFGSVVVQSAGPGKTSYVDKGLLQNTGYYYRVIATHPQQDSPPSNIVLATTPYSIPLAPKLVKVINFTDSAMLVSWTAGGTNQVAYFVETSSNNGSTWQIVASVDGSTTQAEVSGLQEKTSYSVRICASNPASQVTPNNTNPAAGALGTTGGVPSTPVVKIRTLPSVLAAPGAPVFKAVNDATVPAFSAVDLTWNAVPGATGYRVESMAGAPSGSWVKSQDTTTNATTCRVTGLIATSPYDFRVSAINKDSGSSTPAQKVSPPSPNAGLLPSRPNAPSPAAAISDWAAVRVTWSVLDSATWTASRLKASQVVGTTSTPVLQLDLSPQVSTYTHTGLTPDTSYTYTLTVINARGEATSAAPPVKTMKADPSQATLTFHPSARNMVVNWIDSTAAFGDTYKIERLNAAGTTVLFSQDLPAGTASFTDTGLFPSTAYIYRLTVYRASNGHFSTVTSAQQTTSQGANSGPDVLVVKPALGSSFYVNRSDGVTSAHSREFNTTWLEPSDDPSLTANNYVISWAQYPNGAIYFSVVSPTHVGLPMIKNDSYNTDDLFAQKVVTAGEYVFISAPKAKRDPSGAAGTAGAARTGAVYVFGLNTVHNKDSGMSQVARLVPDDGADGDVFGSSLAVSGNKLIVGAPAASVTPAGSSALANCGKVYLFELTDGTWTKKRVETSPEPEAGLNFGASVALRGRHFAIGAPYQDILDESQQPPVPLVDAGAVYFGRWELPGVLTGLDNPLVDDVSASLHSGIAGSHFGAALALDPTLMLLVAAPDHSWNSTQTEASTFYGGSIYQVLWNGETAARWSAAKRRLPLAHMHFNTRIGRMVRYDPATKFFYLTSVLDGNGNPNWVKNISGQNVLDANGNPVEQDTEWMVVPAIAAAPSINIANLEAQDPDGDPLDPVVPYQMVKAPGESFSSGQPAVPFLILSSLDPSLIQAVPGPAVGGWHLQTSSNSSGFFQFIVRARDGGLASTDFYLNLEQDSGTANLFDVPEDWLQRYGLTKAMVDLDASLSGDGLTIRNKYLRYLTGLTSGVDPLHWDLAPNGDDDGDGVPNYADADPFNPARLWLRPLVTTPAGP